MLRRAILRAVDPLLFRVVKRMELLVQSQKIRAAKRGAALDPTAVLHTEAKIRNFLGDPKAITVGAHSHINGELLTFWNGGNIQIGEWSHVGDGSCVWSNKSVSMGNHVLISYLVNISDTNRQPDDGEAQRQVSYAADGLEKRLAAKTDSQPIVIEDDVWICPKATVLKGVHIGRGAIVTVGSVVVEDVPAWTMVAGNPAKVVRELEERREAYYGN